ncbi:MAG: SUMF1/EgtB/PvdO family nonheme iron enzyme [Candidatus Competibacteraceae bacterium]|nr:SUMF1/EgtB/PvdO family nonheme iron enzyme [Candidatus Competibacteraceae bacterium]
MRPLSLLPVQTQLKRYVIGQKLGQGGFGITYRGFDLKLRMEVAIKEYFPSDFVSRADDRKTLVLNSRENAELFSHGLKAFTKEAHTLAQLKHPNLVRVLNLFEMNATAYLVMDYYEGETIHDFLTRKPGRKLPWREAIQVLLPVLDGLQAVHDQGFLHRDVKPRNLYRTHQGQIILLDFGAARQVVSDRSRHSSLAIYSSGYAAFEQHVQGKQGPWTDVYGAAATLYFLLTGHAPPPAPNRKQSDALKPARHYVPTLPPAFDNILRRALAVEQEKRLQSALEFKQQLEATLKAEPDNPPPNAQEASKFNYLAAAIALLLVILAWGGWWLIGSNGTAPKPPPSIAKPVVLQPPVPPVKGTLEISTEPPGATIWVDNIQLGPAPKTIERDDEAIVSVEAMLEGYKPNQKSFSLKPGQHRPVTLWLERKRKSGDVLERDRLKDDNSDGPAMVFIDAGCFSMGSPATEAGRDTDERQHQVCVKEPFGIGRHEVTVGEFRRYIEATGYKTDAEKNAEGDDGCFITYREGSEWKYDYRAGYDWKNPNFQQGDDHPVVCVSWNDANAYVKWLSDQTGQTYRLPTEAEWEYAARGGTETARYWNDDPNQACRYANVADRTGQQIFPNWTIHNCTDFNVNTALVGSFEGNAWGLKDMVGNVWEWTCSAYTKDYDGVELKCADKDTIGPLAVRGGSWNSTPARVRSAFRNWSSPSYRSFFRGFRLARSL